jgi:hypothetical protein
MKKLFLTGTARCSWQQERRARLESFALWY